MSAKRRKLGNVKSGTARMTLQEIGEMFGVSLQAVQQIEYRALRKIRTAIEQSAARAGVSVHEWLYES